MKELGLEDSVIFVGEVAEEEIPHYYTVCNIFIMPSEIEGFGIVFLEANACGKPVIGGKVGGICDAIINEETGLLVDPLNIDQIADSLIRLLTNPRLARRLGKKGKERVQKELNWQGRARKIQKILHEES